MRKRTGKYILRTVFPLVFFMGITGFCSCAREAATLVVPPVTGSLPSDDTGSLYPMIQKVYPGTLQSLDIPQSYPTDISPEYPGIVAVFSNTMENTNNEMASAFELVDVSSGHISINISPSVSSKYFTISPVSGLLKQNTEYILRIYKYAAAETIFTTVSVSRSGNRATIVTTLEHGLSDNEIVTVSSTANPGYNTITVPVSVISTTSFSYDNSGADQGTTADTTGTVKIYNRTLVFNNLVTPPAVTISPADPLYVEYKFRTGADSSADADVTPPSIAFTNIANGAVNVDPNSVGGDGYIEIIFSDNKVPMIDPSTVNDLSVTLYNTTSGLPVPGNISCVFTDTDFKTFRFYPFPDTYLQSFNEYRFRISESPYFVKDFAGNNAAQRDIYFSTGL